ncbi:MAG: hypothetical protein NTX88_11945 [Candidatus Atribacteria bacterium]|nr:hypothetical protein [Candidatus Atribacteria bacterium]
MILTVFNLYHGLREKGWKRYYWLNLKLLTENLLKPYQSLEMVKYFTARISEGDDTSPQWLREKMGEKRRRQANYLETLGIEIMVPGTSVIQEEFASLFGQFGVWSF